MIGFDLKRERRGETSYVIAVAGEVDLYTAPGLERELLAAIDEGGREIAIDLGDATFIDSSFLGVLLGGRRRLSSCGGRLIVFCDDRNMRRVFELTGLDRVFPIETHDRSNGHPSR